MELDSSLLHESKTCKISGSSIKGLNSLKQHALSNHSSTWMRMPPHAVISLGVGLERPSLHQQKGIENRCSRMSSQHLRHVEGEEETGQLRVGGSYVALMSKTIIVLRHAVPHETIDGRI